MLAFKKLTLNDIGIILPYFSLSKTRACDNTIGGTFMWRDFFDTEYAIYNDTLIFKVFYFNNQTNFTFPLGNDVDGALLKIEEYCASQKLPMVFCFVTDNDIKVLSDRYNCTVTKETDWCDYLYNAADLASFAGRKYSGQRNHINRFKKDFPDYRFETISNSNINDVRKMFDEFNKSHDKGTSVFIEEEAKVYEVLDNYDIYGQTGLVLYAADEPVAFCGGEIIGDTLYVHIEKANTDINGAYQMIVTEFVNRSLPQGIEYVNREDDAGDAGLRTSKLSYHPAFMVDKYTVTAEAKL